MNFIVDFRAENISKRLKQLANVVLFDAKDIVYPAICGHPDIFIAKTNESYVLSPNTPKNILNLFLNQNINFVYGNTNVGFRYPQTALYNIFCDKEIAVVSKHTDKKLRSIIDSKLIIEVNQGYIACNLARIGKTFITSDKGIEKQLANFDICYVKPDKIKLQDVSNGFIGGTLAQIEEKIYYTGGANSFYADILHEICDKENKEIVFLSNSEALDVGGIIAL